jgi:hypothetical protein
LLEQCWALYSFSGLRNLAQPFVKHHEHLDVLIMTTFQDFDWADEVLHAW